MLAALTVGLMLATGAFTLAATSTVPAEVQNLKEGDTLP